MSGIRARFSCAEAPICMSHDKMHLHTVEDSTSLTHSSAVHTLSIPFPVLQEGQSRADFVAAFQRAEAMNDNSAPHGGGYGKDIVTVIAQSSQQPKKYLEGRKELEADASTTSTSAGVNSGGMGTGKHQFQHHESSNCQSSPS